jgi:hypothetical protein
MKLMYFVWPVVAVVALSIGIVKVLEPPKRAVLPIVVAPPPPTPQWTLLYPKLTEAQVQEIVRLSTLPAPVAEKLAREANMPFENYKLIVEESNRTLGYKMGCSEYNKQFDGLGYTDRLMARSEARRNGDCR